MSSPSSFGQDVPQSSTQTASEEINGRQNQMTVLQHSRVCFHSASGSERNGNSSLEWWWSLLSILTTTLFFDELPSTIHCVNHENKPVGQADGRSGLMSGSPWAAPAKEDEGEGGCKSKSPSIKLAETFAALLRASRLVSVTLEWLSKGDVLRVVVHPRSDYFKFFSQEVEGRRANYNLFSFPAISNLGRREPLKEFIIKVNQSLERFMIISSVCGWFKGSPEVLRWESSSVADEGLLPTPLPFVDTREAQLKF